MTFKIEYDRGICGHVTDHFNGISEDPIGGCDWFTMDDGISVRDKNNKTIAFYPYFHLIKVKEEERA